MADLDSLFYVLPVMFDATDRHQSKSHALNHFLAFGLSMERRRLPSVMPATTSWTSSRHGIPPTVGNVRVQYWLEAELRPYLRHGVLPTEYPAVHRGIAATANYLNEWIPRYSDADKEEIHAFTLQALITLMALESLALVIRSKNEVLIDPSVADLLRPLEAHKELCRWLERIEALDERVERHNAARAHKESHPFSDLEASFLGHEENFALLRARISQRIAAIDKQRE